MRRLLTIAAALMALPACNREAEQNAIILTGGGDPNRGKEAIRTYGCSSCHTIPGVEGANAQVGPPLDKVGGRVYIAGVLVNTPENLARWIKDPPGVDPKTAMPNLGVTDADVCDISSYLYTLK
jgi:cytochrome c